MSMKKSELIDELLERADLEELVSEVIEKKKESDRHDPPLDAWFLGPKAEHGDIWLETFNYIFRDYVHWRRNYFPEDPIVINREQLKRHELWFETLNGEIDKILNQLKAHFPIYSPRYNAHMVSEQTFPSVVGYFAAMLYNPNNVTEEAAPITLSLEIEVGKMVSEMLGYNPNTSWAHLCSGGTLANTEAHWIARTVQFVPLVVQDYCRERRVKDFEIEMPNRTFVNILELSHRELISLKPNRSVEMLRKLAKHLSDEVGNTAAIDEINAFLPLSRFNITTNGLHSVLREIHLSPVIFVSEAAHYSIKKLANILGYGENSVELVPVDSHFRMNAEALRERLFDLADDKYVASVIGIAGTTEEGAVDPLHEIKFCRDEVETKENRTFWFHVDAAWGGYIRSLFRGHDLREPHEHRTLQDICEEYFEKIGASEHAELTMLNPVPGVKTKEKKSLLLEWRDEEVYSAFLAMPDADSITVDPHKLGYVPYPAGLVAFQRSHVTELVIQKAPYITDEAAGVRNVERSIEIKDIGPFIIEGSKPGAAAAACWLAHRTIPLVANGHGKIIKASLLDAKKFARYIGIHKRVFESIEYKLFGTTGTCKQKFGFELLTEPDTNLVCFLCLPMWEDTDGDLHRDADFALSDINSLNQRIYDRATIKGSKRKRKMPYSQEFFLSRTTLRAEQYKPSSIHSFLEKYGFSIYEYEQHGIFILRSTLMNPWHHQAAKHGKNYLLDLLVNLHQIARDILNDRSD
jgi:glutamate/tyrosine decarboxylase-like PLP-dependent enzyme